MNNIQFSLEDQVWFSEVSGDSNPIHVNPTYARKSLFGEVIVHGMHLVIYALNEFYNKLHKDIKLESLSVTFLKPVKLSQKINLEVEVINNNQSKIKLLVEGITITVLDLKYTYANNPPLLSLKLNSEPFSIPEIFDNFEGVKSIELGIYKVGLEFRYLNLHHILSANQVLNLLGLTRIVGMKSPGLNSIFSSFSINFNESLEDKKIDFSIKSYKKNYSRLVIDLMSETISGSLVAFLRPTSKELITNDEAKTMVKPNQFIGQRALIIGGSRGLGAITTKLLWAGGAEVLFSYHKGEAEANDIVISINDNKVATFQIDVTDSINESIIGLIKKFNPTHIYYYVTPFIFSTNKGVFNYSAFLNFTDYYLKGFYNIVELCNGEALTHVFYPSSTAIDELVDNMIEYSCAKIAGELLCDFLGKINPNLNIVRPRFPRLDTDQTQSLLFVESADTNKKILNSLMEFTKH